MSGGGYSYRHLPEILQQRATRVGGLPILTLWQFLGMLGTAGVGMALEIPIVILVILVFGVFVGLYVHNGEFLILRWFAVLRTATLFRLGKPRTVNLSESWDIVKIKKTTQANVVYQSKSGSGLVTGVQTES